MEPTIKTIEDINNDDSGAKALQGWFVKIENAIVKNISDANTTIAQGDNSIVVRGISEEISVNNIISLTGNVGCFNTVQIVNPQDVTIVSIGAPNINADEEVKLDYNATSGKIDYTIDNPVDGYSLKAVTDADWISNVVVSENSVTFDVTNNDGTTERTAIFTLSYDGAEDVKVTVTQKHLVADVASLPFGFDGGKDDIENKEGLTQEGLDTDYGSSPKMKFNTTGDYLILHFDGTPGTLSFDIKGNSFSGGTFTVQTSVDGETYTDLATYTELGGTTQSEKFSNLGADIRYIKWIYTEKSSGNVALGNIALDEPNNNPSLSADETVNLSAEATSGEIAYNITNPVVGLSLEATTDADWISDLTIETNKVTFKVTANTEPTEREAVVTLTYDDITKNVTVIQAKNVIVSTDKYELVTDDATLKEGDKILIAHVDVEGLVAVAMSAEQGKNNRQEVDVVYNEEDATLSPGNDAQIVTLEGKTDAWYFNVGTGYLYAASSSSNYMKTEEEKNDNAKAKIVIDEAGNAAITFQGEYTRNVLRYNANGSNTGIFSCYEEGKMDNVQIYRKVTSTETVKGDVNGDGSPTIADVTALVNIILGKVTAENNPDNYNFDAADVNNDGSPTIADVTELVNIILGKTN